MNLENNCNSFDSFVDNKDIVNYLHNYKQKKLNSNIIIFGNSGSGKTYLSQILIKFLNKKSLYINFLNIKSQSELSTKIEYFSNQKFNNDLLIIIDDIDTISKNIQNNLINIIEKYNLNITFIFICTNIQILIENLKNKFIFLHLNDISKNIIFKYIKNFAEKEQFEINDKYVEYIINISNNNIINTINNLEKYKQITSNNISNIEDIFSIPSFQEISYLFDLCKKNNIFDLISKVEELHNNGFSYYDNITNLFNFIKKYNDINELDKIEVIKIIGLAFTNDASSENDLIHLIYVFTQIFLIFNKEKKLKNN